MDANNIGFISHYRAWIAEARACETRARESLEHLFPRLQTVRTPEGGTDIVDSVTAYTVWCESRGWKAEDMIRANYPEAG